MEALDTVQCRSFASVFLVHQFDMMVESYVFQISNQCPYRIIHNLMRMIRIKAVQETSQTVQKYTSISHKSLPVPQSIVSSSHVDAAISSTSLPGLQPVLRSFLPMSTRTTVGATARTSPCRRKMQTCSCQLVCRLLLSVLFI